ncbi:hypothetical protein SAMN05660464_3639 [Geodermatophilus dictyosporus]|uniref:Tripartite tricarboxylate transporter TctB family protein n=1 Tax=Geodermatophilus dictyosporus TaxID=1523247 RepID=A0A1I5RPM9_9ACTN|nr:hypothetical protein [Geodermatophilus dictyosporus]SFP60201.1 hypothetical protein SAMN05660464_3639 [Geodermatophilus dictyosporus]
MTTSSTTPATTTRPSPAPDGATLAGAGVALACTFVGQYVDTPWRSGPSEWGVDFAGGGGWGALALLVAFVAVGLAVVALVSARARAVPPERTARRALVLAVLGAVTVLVFWTGLPAVLAGGAVGLALDSKRRLGRLPAPAAAGVAVAVLTVAAAVWLAFTG